MDYSRRFRVKVLSLLTVLVVSLTPTLLSSCVSAKLEHYENPQWNFGLEYPDTWELNDDDRIANDFSLESQKGLFRRSRARILIKAGFPVPEDPPAKLETAMDSYLNSVRSKTHVIKSLEVLQVSEVLNNGSHEMIHASLSVPTSDIVDGIEGAKINQMNQREDHVLQMIDIYILRNSLGQSIAVEVYRGQDEELNSQADDIIESIRFIIE